MELQQEDKVVSKPFFLPSFGSAHDMMCIYAHTAASAEKRAVPTVTIASVCESQPQVQRTCMNETIKAFIQQHTSKEDNSASKLSSFLSLYSKSCGEENGCGAKIGSRTFRTDLCSAASLEFRRVLSNGSSSSSVLLTDRPGPGLGSALCSPGTATAAGHLRLIGCHDHGRR